MASVKQCDQCKKLDDHQAEWFIVTDEQTGKQFDFCSWECGELWAKEHKEIITPLLFIPQSWANQSLEELRRQLITSSPVYRYAL